MLTDALQGLAVGIPGFPPIMRRFGFGIKRVGGSNKDADPSMTGFPGGREWQSGYSYWAVER